ncbi:MAG TPA: thioredoxin domain-containing protein [Nitrospira sp.]|nr:thioredoxin domain-containing protein [Nitrospira sp.]
MDQQPNRPHNRLIDESSPYLRQHAENPVDWYPWGEEALSKAKAEDKPILLSIGYSACHWCHVMAHESFESVEIAKVMNQHFINIKVDREERPDLDEIYQKSAQVFNGRGGGWPLTMFLTPDQAPFYGGTYFPPVPRFNLPGFPEVLLGVAEAYRNHRDEVTKNVERVMNALERVGRPKSTTAPLTDQLLDRAADALGRLFDPVYGGFGDGPKFPTVPPLSLMLRQAARRKDQSLQDQVLLQLRRMAAGGIYDHLGGGFHRYSVDGEWKVPHFEKMLYDNAQLVRIYLDGWRLTKDEGFRHVVEETLEYVRREMTHPDGAFFAAQDADSEGHEGAFFVWTPEEITAVLGAELGGEFCRFYGVTEGGNFEGKNVLHQLNGFELSAEEQEVADSKLRPARAKLLAAREQRVKPLRDENILTSWNAMMVSAFLDAAVTLGVPAYRAAGEQALTYLLDYAVVNGRVCRTVVGCKGRLNGYLDDAAWLAMALLDAFEATSHRWYLDQARAVTESLLTHFGDKTAGGCFFTSHDHERLIQRMKSGTDSAVPSGNAVAASALLRLFSFTGERRYYENADQILKVFQSVMEGNPYSASAMLCSVDWFLSGPKEIVVVGARGNALTEAMVATVYQRYVPNRALLTVDDPRPVGEVELPLTLGKTSVNGRPTAYVCQHQTCSQPVTEPRQLEAML